MNLLKRHLTFIVLFFLFICLCGCPYQSKCPLGRMSKATIDKELIGKWELRGKEESESGVIRVYPFNNHEYLIVSKGNTEKDAEVMRAFGTIIGGHKFLNIQDINRKSAAKRNWFFVNYSVSDNRLTWRTIEEKIFKGKKLFSSGALRAFIKENLDNKSLYPKNPERPLIRIGK